MTDTLEYRFKYQAHHFMTLIDEEGTFNFRPHPGCDVNGWGTSWYAQPFLPGAELKHTDIQSIAADSAGIHVFAVGQVSRATSATYGDWDFTLDFEHALDYVATAGKAVFGEGSEAFGQWFAGKATQLKEKPPQRTIADICLLEAKATSDEQLATIDHCRRYLQKRQELMDYPHFQAKGFPIGSGSVESSDKVVVHSRMKQAGMRWAEDHVDPMLALRNLVCNDRWSQGWSQIVAYHWQQQANKQPPATPPITFASVKVALASTTVDNLPPSPPTSRQPHRPAPDHPWRRGIWPTNEAWRWN